jgi:hypothetical protein
VEENRLTDELRAVLSQIEPSQCRGELHWPCRVWLKSDEIFDRVLFFRVSDLKKMPGYSTLGVYELPEWFSRIPIADIVRIEESPCRLPARFATELYSRGETSMCAYQFTVKFYAGFSRTYVDAGCVDFIDYPPLMSPAWVSSVQPASKKRYRHCPNFRWCFFSE